MRFLKYKGFFRTTKETAKVAMQGLAQYRPPYLLQDVVTGANISNLSVVDDKLHLDLVFGFPTDTVRQAILTEVTQLLKSILPKTPSIITVSSKIRSHSVQLIGQAIPQVKNIIAVTSAKGGVGKSTTTVNLALALVNAGARVGILDADIYGPSIPKMLGSTGMPVKSDDGEKFYPVQIAGIQSMSIAYMMPETAPIIWRGPMISSSLMQLLSNTLWDNLDYLLLDTPPGTGDIQLTLGQKIPVSGAIIVTTPQDIALQDARRGLEMFKQINIPVLGIIENMSHHTCSQCGEQQAIFGEDGGKRLAATHNVRLLGQLPLSQQIQADVDVGKPTVSADPTGNIAMIYQDAALAMVAQLSLQKINHATKFPKIVVE